MEHRYIHHYVSGLGHELDFQKVIDIDCSDSDKEEDQPLTVVPEITIPIETVNLGHGTELSSAGLSSCCDDSCAPPFKNYNLNEEIE